MSVLTLKEIPVNTMLAMVRAESYQKVQHCPISITKFNTVSLGVYDEEFLKNIFLAQYDVRNSRLLIVYTDIKNVESLELYDLFKQYLHNKYLTIRYTYTFVLSALDSIKTFEFLSTSDKTCVITNFAGADKVQSIVNRLQEDFPLSEINKPFILKECVVKTIHKVDEAKFADVGYIIYRLTEDERIVIHFIKIYPEFIKQKIAQKAVSQLVSDCGLTEIKCSVRENNTASLNLFKSVGFAEVDRGKYKNGDVKISLCLKTAYDSAVYTTS